MLASRSFWTLAALTSFGLLPQAAPQAAPPFTLRVQQAQTVSTLADGGTLTLAADAVGVPSTAVVTVTYRGTTSAVIHTSDLTGSLDFTVTGVPDAGSVMTPGQSFNLGVRFLPTTSSRVAGRIVLGFTEGRTSGSLTLNLAGVAPEFSFSFSPQGGNATPVPPGGTITMALSPVDTATTTTVIVTNRGTGPGVLNAIRSSNEAFQLVGLPLPPATVEAGREVRFSISFTPKQLNPVTGSLSVELVNRTVSFQIQGSGSGPLFAYETVQESTVTALLANQLVLLPDVAINEKSLLTVRVRNNGNAEGRIAAISVAGAGFQLADVPFLPLTLNPGAGASFTVQFSPSQAGRASGRLRIGNDTFDVASNGLGAVLAYAFTVGSATNPVQNNGSVIFTPTAVGQTGSVRFQINNTGTAATPISSISITAGSTIFSLSETPALPMNLGAGESASVTIQFAPTALGAAAGTLRVDNQSFTLSGTGNSPAPLPQYRFDGPSGAQEPLQQPAIGLTLAQPYSLPLSGTLTLAFSSEVFSNDPTVQFATGGRTVNFTIPANATRAVFSNNSQQIRVQTGTVAGTISLTPSFATEGGINMTPVTPPALNLTVAPSAPRLLSVTVGARTASGFSLLVTGYSTSRSVSQMEFQFTPVSGESVATTRLSLSVDSAFLAWYQGNQSQAFGSLFTATVPFTLQGDVKDVATPAETVQSISVTISNRLGASAAQSVSLK